MSDYYVAVSEAVKKKEKAKARELKASAWWKGQTGKGICYHCQQRVHPSELTMDHLIPIARGGKSDKKNCVPSCKTCNTQKGVKTQFELALENLKK